MDSNSNKTFIILGGSSFMGLTLLRDISKIEGATVYVINRGRIYWDNLSQAVINSSQKMFHIKSDRRKIKQFGQDMLSIFEKHEKIDAIIDFCAYDLDDIQAAFGCLDDKIDKLLQYIFVSTDS